MANTRYYIFDNEQGYSDYTIAFVKATDLSCETVQEIARWCGFPLLVAVFYKDPDLINEASWVTLDEFVKNYEQAPGDIDARATGYSSPLPSSVLLAAPSLLLEKVAAFEEAACTSCEGWAQRRAQFDTDAMRATWKKDADQHRARAAAFRAELARRAKGG